jgi:hypothetical protein
MNRSPLAPYDCPCTVYSQYLHDDLPWHHGLPTPPSGLVVGPVVRPFASVPASSNRPRHRGDHRTEAQRCRGPEAPTSTQEDRGSQTSLDGRVDLPLHA